MEPIVLEGIVNLVTCGLYWHDTEVLLTKSLLFAGLVAALGLPCFASSFYIGSDSACFYGLSASPCTPVDTPTSTGVDLSGNPILTYTPDSGFSAPESGGSVELGNFYVSPALLGVSGANFMLDISFTDPANGDQVFNATTYGLVVFGQLGAEVTFSQPTTQTFIYPGGAFDVSLPSTAILIGAGDTVPLDATITPVPEPASVASVLGGVMLLGILGFRRQKDRILGMFAPKTLS
jgi:hypothetical protein